MVIVVHIQGYNNESSILPIPDDLCEYLYGG